jgi:hypothetical protein
MAKMLHDDFEAWLRERSSGCMEQSEIDGICEGDLDFDSGEYTFRDQSVQAQWEAWQAGAKASMSPRVLSLVAAAECFIGNACRPNDDGKFDDMCDDARRKLNAAIAVCK